jgi:hypothetical protein
LTIGCTKAGSFSIFSFASGDRLHIRSGQPHLGNHGREWATAAFRLASRCRRACRRCGSFGPGWLAGLNLLIQIGGHLSGTGLRLVLQRAAGHFKGLRGGCAPAQLHAQRADHLRFARVGHHRELGVAGGAGKEHPKRTFRRLFHLLEGHIRLTIQANKFHKASGGNRL